MRQLALAATALLAAAACGSAAASPARPVAGAAPRVRYTVVAPLLRTRRSHVTLACQTELMSYPPAGCSGVVVTGLDIRNVPSAIRVSGVWMTRPLRLTGTWDRHSLHLTARPTPSSAPPALSPPMRCRVPGTSFASALADRIAANHVGLDVLSTSACGSTAWVLVAVADAHAVSAIHRRFGRRVIVSGWLRPARAQ